MRALLAGCVGVAAISLLVGGAPTYDPWAWILWGREIAGGELDTRNGPSWKPLPILFTTPFALAGDEAAPALWLAIARAGGLLALAMLFRLGTRVAGAVGGAVAVAGLILSEGFVRHAARGFSEGMLVGLVLLAIDRHLEGHRAQAFLAGAGAALLRPEVWPFWGLYGLWLAWRDPRTRALVAAGFAAIPVGWLVPERIGSGDFLRAAERARQPNLDSPAFADRPFLEVLERSASLLEAPVYAGALVAVALVVTRRVRRRKRSGDALLLALAGGAAALVVAVALMTEAGFAGNLRYVALPAALVCLLAGAGAVALVRAAPPGLARTGLAVALAAACVPFALGAAADLRDDIRSVRSEADFDRRLGETIERLGGRDRVNACGGVFTGRFQVPAVAWRLRRHLYEVEIFAFPPGWTLAPRHSALSHDPRFETVLSTRKWVAGRNCQDGSS